MRVCVCFKKKQAKEEEEAAAKMPASIPLEVDPFKGFGNKSESSEGNKSEKGNKPDKSKE